MRRLSLHRDSRSRSLLISVVSGCALLLLAIAVFSVAGQARSLSTQAERSVQVVEDLRVASFAHSEITAATRVAELAPEQTDAISESIDNALTSLDSLEMSLDEDTPEDTREAFTSFEQAVTTQAEVLGGTTMDSATLISNDDHIADTFDDLATAMRSDQLDAVTALESDNDLLNLIATMSTFIVAFVVPSAALFVFQALRAAPRELRALRLNHDRTVRRSLAMAAAVSEEASELRGQLSTNPNAVSIGSVKNTLRRFEHISVTNGAPSTVRSQHVNVFDAVAESIEDLEATSEVTFGVAEELVTTADNDQLRVIITELLLNAQDHGEGPIAVYADATPDEVLIRVVDSGLGIEDATVNALLHESDYELRESAADGAYGYGLLAARRSAESMGGALRYERDDDQTHLVLSLPIGAESATTQSALASPAAVQAAIASPTKAQPEISRAA